MKLAHKHINIIINLLIIILEIIGFVLVFKEMGITSLEYYTEDSNLLLLLSSIILLTYISKNNELPSWFKSFRYIAIVSTTLTLIIVLTVPGQPIWDCIIYYSMNLCYTTTHYVLF